MTVSTVITFGVRNSLFSSSNTLKNTKRHDFNLPNGKVSPHGQSQRQTHRDRMEDLRHVVVQQHEHSPVVRKVPLAQQLQVVVVSEGNVLDHQQHVRHRQSRQDPIDRSTGHVLSGQHDNVQNVGDGTERAHGDGQVRVVVFGVGGRQAFQTLAAATGPRGGVALVGDVVVVHDALDLGVGYVEGGVAQQLSHVQLEGCHVADDHLIWRLGGSAAGIFGDDAWCRVLGKRLEEKYLEQKRPDVLLKLQAPYRKKSNNSSFEFLKCLFFM